MARNRGYPVAMRLVLFTPTVAHSAIGRMAALVSRELLAQGCQVSVVRTEVEKLSSDTHDFGAAVVWWEDEDIVWSLASQADAVVYHIGDNFSFHAGCVHWLSKLPGLLCLHDFYLGHLFHEWGKSRHAQAELILQSWYGRESAKKFFGFSDSQSFIAGTREEMPMTEWITSQAQGVITHSDWGCNRVLTSCPGPVVVVPLAYDAPCIAEVEEKPPDGHRSLRLLTIGHVNANKRASSVIKAIGGSSQLREHVTYRLVGAIQPDMEKHLLQLAGVLGVKLIISGEVDASTLVAAISESDVSCCLRWPILEAASASTIESMLYGKAVLVMNDGFYAEIPDHCVMKINHNNEIQELRASLEELLADKSKIYLLGTEAKRWASDTFSAKKYAAQTRDTILEILMSVPPKNAIDGFCKILNRWSPSLSSAMTDFIVEPLRIFEYSGERRRTRID